MHAKLGEFSLDGTLKAIMKMYLKYIKLHWKENNECHLHLQEHTRYWDSDDACKNV